MYSGRLCLQSVPQAQPPMNALRASGILTSQYQLPIGVNKQVKRSHRILFGD